VNTVFSNAIDSLSEDDKDLPQVGAKKGRKHIPKLFKHFRFHWMKLAC